MTGEGSARKTDAEKVLRYRQAKPSDEGDSASKVVRKIKLQEGWIDTQRNSPEEVASKVVIAEEEGADKELSQVVDELIAQLQTASTSRDLPTLLALVRRILDHPKEVLGCNQIPIKLKLAALQALAPFGVDATAEMVEFLGDEEPDVSNMAMNELRTVLRKYGIGDRIKSAIIVAASTKMTDSFDIKRFYMEIRSMRPSVATETVLAISQTGTAEAKALLPDTISSYTGMYGTSTVEGMQEWLVENPDPANAERRYGPKR